MNEEIENQPAPLETESVSAEQRHHRPRRRYPRRRYRDRGDRFGRDNSGESPNSSAVIDPNSADAGVETLDRRSRAKVPKERSKTANRFRLSRNSAKVSSRFRARGSDSCAIQSAILCRHRRTFSSRRKSFAVLLCATACGFTAKHAAAAAVLNWSSYSTINGEEPTKYQGLRPFEELTTINPNKRIKLETVPDRYTTRIMDLMTPLGMGQRGLIVAPPRTGKTTLLHHIADAVAKNHPEVKLIILLVDERPEEVTDFRRSHPAAELMASSNDADIKSHTRIAQLAIERAKRLVEAGKHVFILLDSITRTARAFNNAMAGGGRTMSGGIDARAMEIPRKIFAAARNTEEAGSLTIVATALIETGSRMDELIFQEFKGTGNMEMVLDRKISDQRIYPAIDIFLSGTRREELLLQPWELEKINLIRRGLAGHKPEEAIQRLLMFVKKFPTNAEMLKGIPG